MYFECFIQITKLSPKRLYPCWFPAASKMASTTQCWPTGHYNVLNICQFNELKKAVSVFCLAFLWLSMRINSFSSCLLIICTIFVCASCFSYTWPIFFYLGVCHVIPQKEFITQLYILHIFVLIEFVFFYKFIFFSSLYIIKVMDAQRKNTNIYNNIKQMLKISQISSSQLDSLVYIPANIFSYLYPTNYISFQIWNHSIHIVFNLNFHLPYLIYISLSIQTAFSFLIVIYYCDCVVFLT